jgi:putative aldouronate transport system substrate-binding protein
MEAKFMKKNFTRVLALILIMALAISLAACGSSTKEPSDSSVSTASGSSDNTATAEPVKTVELTAGGNFLVAPGVPNDPIMAEITKVTGVTLKMIDTAGDKIKVLAASGDLPDLISYDTNSQKQYIEGGLIIPLDDLLASNGQNIAANASEMVKFNKEYVSNKTGKLYYIAAGIDNYSSITAVFNPWIRWDYYKELGYPQINNYDDLFNVAAEMVKRHPKTEDGQPTYAVSTFSDWKAGSLLEMPGGELDRAVGGAGLYEYDLKANAFTLGITTPNSSWYKASKFFNKAKRAGILDPDTYIQTGEIYGNKEKAGRYMVCFENWNALEANANFRAAGKADQGYMPLPVPQGAAAYWGQAWPVGNNQAQIAISSKCKEPEKAMDLLNFTFSNDGARLIYNGIKDVNYKTVDGILQWTAETKNDKKTMAQDFALKTGIGKYNQFAGFGRFVPASDGQYLDLTADPKALGVDTANAEPWALLDDFCAHYGVTRLGDTVDFRQFGKMTTDQTLLFRTVSQAICPPAPQNINDLNDKLESYYMKEFPKLIMKAKTDAEFETGYQNILAGMKKLGLDEFAQYWDKAYADAVQKSNEIIGTNNN